MSRPDDLDAGALTAVVRRALGTRMPFSLERTAEGTSTPVYRLHRGDEVFFVRAAEHRDHHLDVEVAVHERLRGLGVSVPEVVFHEPFDRSLGRGVAILAALPGSPVGTDARPAHVAAVYRAAGRDLARIETVPVIGYGFLVRDGDPWPLRGPHRCAADALLVGRPSLVAAVLGEWLTPARAEVLEEVVETVARPAVPATAVLVHGDVDPAHVFHLDGRYTGLIDLGELRGSSPGDDLARFRLWVGEGPALDALTAGYAELTALTDDHPQRSAATAALLGIQQLCRWHARDGDAVRARPAARFLVDRVCALLDDLA